VYNAKLYLAETFACSSTGILAFAVLLEGFIYE